jgi:glyoxylase-like metal-dependent hydrolase (beta-lactamase superfamily II)
MKIGRYTVDIIETGRFRLDGGAMFGVVPKTLWEKATPADSANTIAMTTRSLLLRDDVRIILVDTGIGDTGNEKFRSIYSVDRSEHEMVAALAAVGLTPADVTDVILTHLHFDHAGGCVREADGQLELLFPDARHFVQKRHWLWALEPSEKDRASFIAERFLPLHDAGILTLLDEGEEVFTDIDLHVVDGHTFAQQLVRIEGDDASVLYAADLIPMSAHIPAPWVMSYDLQPLVTLREKHAVLERAAEHGDILVFEHDPLVEAATVLRGNRGYTMERSGTLQEMLAASRV